MKNVTSSQLKPSGTGKADTSKKTETKSNESASKSPSIETKTDTKVKEVFENAPDNKKSNESGTVDKNKIPAGQTKEELSAENAPKAKLSPSAIEAAKDAAALLANSQPALKIDYTITDKERSSFNLKEFIKKHFIAGAARQNYEIYEIHLILERAMVVMKNSPILLELRCPVNICGDIHGQYGDLMRIFNACGLPFKHRYLFLGDYVDRGRHSLEVIMLLLALRIQFPRKVYLLRGNHELLNINRVYGFNAEIRQRYRNLAESKALYDHFNEVFAQMPLAALVSGRILCMHGGLSPSLNSLDDIRKLQRPLRIVRGLAQDLLWADPETGTKGFQPNKIRAVSHVFGEEIVRDKCKQLNIDLIIRAHQVVEFGYAFFCGRSLITVFSAARYHEELVNYAAVVKVDASLELSFVQLKPQEFEKVRKEMEQKHDETGDPGDDQAPPVGSTVATQQASSTNS
ncbi:phosphoprotein phosphatase 1 domain protein [Dictyocaulus viviparus]|uniref:Serine/threonine-protein phosphatase n=1 Tax=Dictyocaulus viviparus TaxID=29172 RepID=A0A0D8Y7T6_DICVI|nr:phosphoprotein phosphatase 1 domain protein [Dictyocaulus viviparus]